MHTPTYGLRDGPQARGRAVVAALTLAAATTAVGCAKNETAPTTAEGPKPAAATKSAPVPASAPAGAETAPAGTPRVAEGWRAIAPPTMTKAEAERLAAAKATAKALGTRLKARLLEAVGPDADFVAGIGACQVAAPEIASTVAKETGHDVGRTSFKVRNPGNRPRPWAQPIVDARYAKPVLLAGPDGRYAFMAPIKMDALCVNCHGAKAQIAEPVAAKLAALYPKDEAVGFAPGDLRGWFWVEMKPSE